MSDKNNGGPAFPCVDNGWNGEEQKFDMPASQGMTLRDYAALKILQGFCANPAVFAPNGMQGWGLVNCDEDQLTHYALFIADNYLKARQS